MPGLDCSHSQGCCPHSSSQQTQTQLPNKQVNSQLESIEHTCTPATKIHKVTAFVLQQRLHVQPKCSALLYMQLLRHHPVANAIADLMEQAVDKGGQHTNSLWSDEQ